MNISSRGSSSFCMALLVVASSATHSAGQFCEDAYECTCGGLFEDDCTPVLANCWWEMFLRCCDTSLTVEDGTCVNDTRWLSLAGDFQNTWAHWALSWQRDVLARGEPINWVMHIATHNAYNSAAVDGYLLPNQFFSMTDQLRAGSRSLALDIHRFGLYNHVRLSHAKENHLGSAAWDRLFVQGMKEIAYWLTLPPPLGGNDAIVFLEFEV